MMCAVLGSLQIALSGKATGLVEIIQIMQRLGVS